MLPIGNITSASQVLSAYRSEASQATGGAVFSSLVGNAA